jgi:hypothetical protein
MKETTCEQVTSALRCWKENQKESRKDGNAQSSSRGISCVDINNKSVFLSSSKLSLELRCQGDEHEAMFVGRSCEIPFVRESVVVLSRLACFITYSATDPCSNVSNSIVSRNARTLHFCATEVPESITMRQCNEIRSESFTEVQHNRTLSTLQDRR